MTSASLAALLFAPALALGGAVGVLAGGWVPERRGVRVLGGRGNARPRGLGRRSPVVEVTTALLVTACVAHFGLTPRTAVVAFFLSTLVLLAVIDAELHLLPNRIVLPAAAAVLAAQVALLPEQAVEWVLAAVLAAGVLLLAHLAYPPGMGIGDVKLALLLGAALGSAVAVALVIGFVAAAIAAVFVLARGGRAARRSTLPFGPFLALGAVVATFVGEQLVAAYLGTL